MVDRAYHPRSTRQVVANGCPNNPQQRRTPRARTAAESDRWFTDLVSTGAIPTADVDAQLHLSQLVRLIAMLNLRSFHAGALTAALQQEGARCASQGPLPGAGNSQSGPVAADRAPGTGRQLVGRAVGELMERYQVSGCRGFERAASTTQAL